MNTHALIPARAPLVPNLRPSRSVERCVRGERNDRGLDSSMVAATHRIPVPEAPIVRPAHTARLVLASTSPRRRQLLHEHGFVFEAVDPRIEDDDVARGRVPPGAWVTALAYLKAMAGVSRLADAPDDRAVLLAADTVVVLDGELIGKPRDEDDAERMIVRLSRREHDVVTGVALVQPFAGRRTLFADRARVRVGDLPIERVRAYVASGAWRGKAGGYNLEDRLQDGWPVEHDGDPATVMGLPMGRLAPMLRRLGVPLRPVEPAGAR